MTIEATEWDSQLREWGNRFAIKSYSPARPSAIEKIEMDIGPLPTELRSFYCHSNGLVSDWFLVLPIEDETNRKHTWDGIRRANSSDKTPALGGDAKLLARFLVFARIGEGKFAVIDRTTGCIWYEENGDLVQTSLALVDFIETCLREVRDL